MMSALQENTTHVVVQYCRQSENDELLVDLVVRSWVFYSSTIKKWICKYPQPKDANHVIKWVRDCLPPKEDFLEYNVRIIKEASSYKIGLRYLKDSYTTSEIKSINGDFDYDSADPENPEIYSAKDVQKILSVSKKISKEKSPVGNGPSNRKSENEQGLKVQKKKSKEYVKEKSPVDDGPSNRKSENERGVKVQKKKSKEYVKEKSPVDDGPSNRKSENERGVKVQKKKSKEYVKEKSPVDNGPGDKKASTATKSPQRFAESPAPSDGTIDHSTSDLSIEAESDSEGIDNEIRESSWESDETTGVRSPVNTPSVACKGTVAKPDKTGSVRSPRRVETSTSKNDRIGSTKSKKLSSKRSNRERPVVASLSDLKDFEERINKKIQKAKRSILYNISKVYRVVKASAVAGDNASGDEEAPLETVLGMRFPLENIVEFESFEAKLKDADAKTVVKKYMSLFSCGTTPQEDIANILPELIRKNVQLLFSGSGKVQKGKGKRNFSATETYCCMEEILLKKYRDKFGRKQIKSFAGIWLSRAGDREGGKIEREAKAAAERGKRAGNHEA